MTNQWPLDSWLKENLFQTPLISAIGPFEKILKFEYANALGPGENYATLMLRVQIEVLKNGETLRQTFMLKVPPDTQIYRDQMSKYDIFKIERGMYSEVVPELENYYAQKGRSVTFGAKAYRLPVEQEHILLEDLRDRGFHNVKRQDGLDWLHSTSVLKKLAQWHAASAVRVAERGPYADQYCHGFLTESGRAFSEQMFAGALKFVLAAVQRLPQHSQYYKQLSELFTNFTDVIFSQAHIDAGDFNVLNHGDFWCNNIMFQHGNDDDDRNEHVLDIYFVDFQMPRYGSPAQDLWYFILSSTRLDIKVQRFDELISYYHQQLIEHLKLLDYTGTLPKLRSLHKKLFDMGSWAVMTVVCIMSGVLCDPTEQASIDNFVQSSPDGDKFKKLLYFNDRFLQHLAVILPWLHRRGAFEQ